MRPKTSGSPKKQIQPNLYKVELLTDYLLLIYFYIGDYLWIEKLLD